MHVKLFEIARDAHFMDKPTPTGGFSVEATTQDRARRLAEEQVRSNGREIRSVSHLADGGLSIIVFAEDEKTVLP
jgi:hypothetical protein